jgi:hypothetical protein
MDEILVNKVLKGLGVKPQTSSSNTGANNLLLSDATSQQSQLSNRPSLDTITKSYTVSQILSTYQLISDELNTNITNSFLSKGVLPSKEDIESIRSLINNFSSSVELENIIDKAVNSNIRNLDSNHVIVKEAIESDLNAESLQKDLQKLKAEVLQDKLIPTKLKIEIVNTIDKTNAQIDSILKEAAIPIEKTSDLTIQERLIKSVNESGAKKLDRIIDIASKALVDIKTALEDGIASQLQKEPSLIDTGSFIDELEQIKNNLAIDRKSLMSQIENQLKELVTLKDNIQKIGVLNNSSSEEGTQAASAMLNKKLPEFVKALNVIDTILAKFGEFISAFPQSSKATPTTSMPQSEGEVSVSVPLSPKTGGVPLSQEIVPKVPLDVLPAPANKSTSQGSLNLLPTQLSGALDAIVVNLETIKGILNQTIELPPSVAIKQLVSILENKFPEILKMFTAFGIEKGEFPELKKLQDQLSVEKNKMSPNLSVGNSKINNTVEVASKTINLAALKSEIEKLESEFIKSHEVIQSIKKNHESVVKAESKQVIQQLLEKSTVKSELFHAFEIRQNPMVETQPTKVEIRQNKNKEDPNEKQSFSFLLDLDLTNVGSVKAQLYSSDKIKQINLVLKTTITKL